MTATADLADLVGARVVDPRGGGRDGLGEVAAGRGGEAGGQIGRAAVAQRAQPVEHHVDAAADAAGDEEAGRRHERDGQQRDEEDRALAGGRDRRGADGGRLAELLRLRLDGPVRVDERGVGRLRDADAVGAGAGDVALADECDGGRHGLAHLRGGGLVGHQAARHVEHGEALGLGQRLVERVAVVVLPRRGEPRVERRVVARDDRLGLDVERLAHRDLHRHDLLVEHRADLGVGGAIGQRVHPGDRHGGGDHEEQQGQAEC